MKKFTFLFIALFLSLSLFTFLSFIITMTVSLEPTSSARIFACTQCPKSKHSFFCLCYMLLTEVYHHDLYSVCHTIQSVSASYCCRNKEKVAVIDDSFLYFRKRHMENPNIHNIPYVRSRDQKRWKGHAKKVVSKEETTER